MADTQSEYQQRSWIRARPRGAPDYFEECTTFTDLPSGYDDCPTAGEFEAYFWVFSFGSFHATSIAANTTYYGSWNLSGGSATTSEFKLQGQENWHSICPFDNIECMFGKRTTGAPGQPPPLFEGYLIWSGIPTCVHWAFAAENDDLDSDGLLNLVETGTAIYVSPSNTGTNPLNPDSDGDGFFDGLEVQAGSNPNSGGSTPPDTDLDGRINVQDNCTLVANASQLDVNSEGFGNICDPDVTDDGIVGIPDLNLFMSRCFGKMVGPGACGCVEDPTCGESDFTGDGIVGIPDLAILQPSLGQPPGPSGLTCADTIPCP